MSWGKIDATYLTNVSQGSERINRLKAGWKGNERSGDDFRLIEDEKVLSFV